MMEITTLGSGSAGNAFIVRLEAKVLLIDAGFSGIELSRRLGNAGIEISDIIAILISHEHDDHIQGARVFAKRNGNIPAYANSLTVERLRMMNKSPENISIFANGIPFEIGPFKIEAFSVCHDAVDPVGFIIQGCGRKVGIATDFGHPGKLVPLKLYDSSLIILESNHDPELLRNSKRPAHLQHRILGRRGHLSNQGAANLLPEVVGPMTKHIILAHLSDDCNRPKLAHQTIRNRLFEIGRDDIGVSIASQKSVGETIKV